MHKRQTAILLALAGIILFSTKAIFVKLAYQFNADPITMLLLRMVFSLPFYVFFAFYRNSEKSIATNKDYGLLILFGFLGYYLASYFDFKGLIYVKASLERLILFTYPTFVILYSYYFLNIRINRNQLWAILITYVGILIVFVPEVDIGDQIATIKGTGLILLSALTYGAYIFGSGWLIPKFGARRFTSYVMIISSALIIVQFLVESKMQINVLALPKGIYILGFLIAIVSTVIPSFLISFAIKELGANQFSIYGSVGPISTISLAFVFLGERMTGWQVFGGLVVIAGVLAAEYYRKQVKTLPESPAQA